MRIRHRAGGRAIFRCPLMGASRAFRQFPIVVKQVREVAVAPRRRRRGPDHFQAAGDRVHAVSGAKAVLPAEALLLDGRALRLRSDILVRIGRAMGLAEGVSAGDEGHRLLVVHRHTHERLADVAGRAERVRVAVRPLRVDVDQAHLHGGQRAGEMPVAAIALVATEPLVLRPPVDVLLRLPGVGAPAGEPERLEPHRLQRAVAGQDQQVGPGNLAAILLLDRPQQPPRLVQVRVVRPAIERREPLRAGACAAATVADAVGACAVPRHADEERPVMAVIGWPPRLRIRHQGKQVLLHGVEVEALERFGVIERLVHGIADGGILVKKPEVELVRPPCRVRHFQDDRVLIESAAHHRAFACALAAVSVHLSLSNLGCVD